MPSLYNLNGHITASPAETFLDLSMYCRDNSIEHDTYGKGENIHAFEQKITTLLGYPESRFVITGTMAQATILQVVLQRHPNRIVAMHSSSHITHYEQQGFQFQHRFINLPLGHSHRLPTAEDIENLVDPVGAILIELPMRHLGGQLPSWDELQAIKQASAKKGIHLHLDGARLWEAQAYYQKSFVEICDGFDSAYVSFYKGIGAMGGAMILAQRDIVAECDHWFARQGGNLYRRTPYVMDAARQFDQRIEQIPKYRNLALKIAQKIRSCSHLKTNPSTVQCNLFHVHIQANECSINSVGDQLEADLNVRIFNRVQPGFTDSSSYFEWTIGEAADKYGYSKICEVIDHLDKLIGEL